MENVNVGQKIQQIRIMNKLDVEQLAENAGLSVDTIEQIEAGRPVLSLTPLLKLTKALGIKFAPVIDHETIVGPVVTENKKRKATLSFADSTIKGDKTISTFFSLGGGKPNRHMEPFLIEVDPPDSTDTKLSSHEGEEFIYVLEGAIVLKYGKKTFKQKKGDTIYYDAIIPHSLYAADNKPAKILAVISGV